MCADGNLNGAGDDLQEQLPTNSNVEEVIVAQNSEGNQVCIVRNVYEFIYFAGSTRNGNFSYTRKA